MQVKVKWPSPPQTYTLVGYQGLPTYLQMELTYLVLNKCATKWIFGQIKMMFKSENEYLIQILK